MKPKVIGNTENWRKRRKQFRNDKRNDLKRYRRSHEEVKSRQTLNIMSLNCNGLAGKMDELADFMELKELDVIFLSEVKLRSGSRFTRFGVEGFKDYAELRLEDQGGMVAYVSSRIGKYATKWDGLEHGQQEWMSSERLWIKVDAVQKVAVCGIYLRCNPGIFSEANEKNEELLNHIHTEANFLRQQGFSIIVMGDMNAHGGDCEQFGFANNTHGVNRNGSLLIEWLSGQSMKCLNNRNWLLDSGERVVANGEFSFQRMRDDRMQKSLIDYGFVDEVILNKIVSFEVNEENYIDSDHNPLLLSMKMVNTDGLAEEPVHESVNWERYTQVVEHLASDMSDVFEELSCESKYRVIKDYVSRAVKNVSSQKNWNWKIRSSEYRDSKLRELLVKRRSLACKSMKSMATLGTKDMYIKALRDFKAVRDQIVRRRFRLETENRFKRSVEAGGRGSRDFWSFLKNESRDLPQLSAVTLEDGSVSRKFEDRENALNDHLRDKFCAKSTPFNCWEEVNVDLHESGNKLSEVAARRLVEPITEEELRGALKTTKTNSAPGPDGITVKSLKLLPEVAVQQVLSFFNEVLMCGYVPEDWKAGKLTMIRKKYPETLMSNMRPICLVSVVGKWFTKILAARISDLMVDEELAGDQQCGFRKKRRTLDNIFLLNGIVEECERSGEEVLFMSVDLKSAYDLVPRSILLEKLRKMNFPVQYRTFLYNYYSGDYVQCRMGEVNSRRHYLGRGLRQGCNLSPVLFALFVSELCERMDKLGGGYKLGDKWVNCLLFADDIVLVAKSSMELMWLQLELEKFCMDVKMKVSREKTVVISSRQMKEWPYLLPDAPHEDLMVVAKARYLGVEISDKLAVMQESFDSKLRKKCISYVRAILKYRGSWYSHVQSCLAVWNNIALPSMLYGVEVVPIKDATLRYLDLQQRIMGKAILDVPSSSANACVELELGLRPISEIIAERKMLYFNYLETNMAGSKLVKEMFLRKKRSGDSQLIVEVERIKRAFPVGLDIKSDMKDLGRLRLSKEIAGKVSLMGISLPTKAKLWKAQPYVILDDYYGIIARFRTQNAGRGNRDNSRELLAPGSHDGTVKVCQLCLEGLNNEVHMLVQCRSLDEFRANYALGDSTLEEFLNAVDSGPDAKFRKLMDLATMKANNRGHRRMLMLGKLLKKIVEVADTIWFDNIASVADL